MPTRKTEGIFLTSNRTFYYLETGDMTVRSHIDRLRNILIQRDLLSYHRDQGIVTEPPYKIMTFGQAQDSGISTEAIYISKHVKNIVESKTQNQGKSLWAK